MASLIDIAEIPSINPLCPPILGDFIRLGGTPQIPDRKYPAPLSQWSLLIVRYESCSETEEDAPHATVIASLLRIGKLVQLYGTRHRIPSRGYLLLLICGTWLSYIGGGGWITHEQRVLLEYNLSRYVIETHPAFLQCPNNGFRS